MSRLSDPLNPGLGLNGVTSNCIRQTPLSPSLRCKMHREHQKKSSVHPGPTADRIRFFSTGCHFTLGLCVCVFFATRESFYALLAKFYQMSNLYSLDRLSLDF